MRWILPSAVVLFCDMLDQLARDPAKMEGMKVGAFASLPNRALSPRE
jgi:hypothetical protein